MRAATPHTYGLAMLVPVIWTHCDVMSNPEAATTSVPSAAMSGLLRPSRVGPRLEVTWAALRERSTLATEKTFGARQGADHPVARVRPLAEGGGIVPHPTAPRQWPGSSRSIHASN